MGSSLNSNDVFVLCNAKVGFLWYGKGCSGDERELAKEVAGIVSPKFKDDFTIVMEGKEPDDFWNILGGKTEYATGGRLVVGFCLFFCPVTAANEMQPKSEFYLDLSYGLQLKWRLNSFHLISKNGRLHGYPNRLDGILCF